MTGTVVRLYDPETGKLRRQVGEAAAANAMIFMGMGGVGRDVAFSPDGKQLATGGGNIVVNANQAGNSSYQAAPQVQATITAMAAPTAIAFNAPAPGGNSATVSGVVGSSNQSGNVTTEATTQLFFADSISTAIYSASSAYSTSRWMSPSMPDSARFRQYFMGLLLSPRSVWRSS